ncbi:hypothetical protein SAMD00019534_123680 [Acytostelium subglobosum LB1]|uniref:hypothetical protein n=1 Tax=Acytostelium subglobosum LB1 TaxID=1410327 RepID=UPI000644F6AB|nr:hypothetical protein SAMD00019534_123680 [Acytostelium subglobosum LB1]GAM29192.1 hypothetical protein SAMD00019534_123680 [Acytostelium subglobosum LB1]|eukprot:XP_012747883.1 hypothetical protein SAMD00019534_123680 [Acytostelium subglobosum LB1]
MSTSSNSSVNVWYITGCSTGLGKALVQTLLNNGQKVAATSRDKKALNDIFGPDSESFLALQVDLLDESSIQSSVRQTTARFGTIDIVLNNPGYGLSGVIEELSINDIKDNFAVNFYAPLAVIRAITPILRAKRSGYIINVTSIMANFGLPAYGAYSASKAALEVATESLAEEMKPFGIKVLTVNPGGFNTDIYSGSKFRVAAQSIDDYQPFHKEQATKSLADFTKGDPAKLANIVFKLVVDNTALPLHIYIGEDSNFLAKLKAESWLKDLATWNPITSTTNRDDL